jgi:hypothetical protein
MSRPRFYIPKPLEAATPEGRQAQQVYMANLLDRARAGRDALIDLIERATPPAERQRQRAEQRRQSRFERHMKRWLLFKEAFAQGTPWPECWRVVAETLSDAGALVGQDAIETSYKMIQAAGGEHATLETYRAEVRRRAQQKAAARRRKQGPR